MLADQHQHLGSRLAWYGLLFSQPSVIARCTPRGVAERDQWLAARHDDRTEKPLISSLRERVTEATTTGKPVKGPQEEL